MADVDEDWKHFLESTEDDPDDDEVETGEPEDEKDDDEDEDAAEPGDKPKKKSTPEKGKKADDAEEDDSDEDPDDPDKAKEKGKPEEGEPDPNAYKSRLTQFHTDKGELDVKKLEDAYISSGKEAVRINGELEDSQNQVKQLLSAIAKDPEIAKKLLGEEGAKKLSSDGQVQPTPKDPIMADYEAKLTKKSKEEYEAFIETHPESVSDPVKAKQISEFLKFYGPYHQKTHDGEIAGMKESLEAAYRHFGWDLEIKKIEDKASAAKRIAATRSTTQSKKPASKNAVTKQEAYIAKKLGVKL